ncbi:MAG: hypothetical protein Q7K42_04120, partial [Candidatus Diapherotrites archaeon]|nr:hypothetical protein [Candidatus Diapherotrites archaeon]
MIVFGFLSYVFNVYGYVLMHAKNIGGIAAFFQAFNLFFANFFEAVIFFFLNIMVSVGIGILSFIVVIIPAGILFVILMIIFAGSVLFSSNIILFLILIIVALVVSLVFAYIMSTLTSPFVLFIFTYNYYFVKALLKKSNN